MAKITAAQNSWIFGTNWPIKLPDGTTIEVPKGSELRGSNEIRLVSPLQVRLLGSVVTFDSVRWDNRHVLYTPPSEGTGSVVVFSTRVVTTPNQAPSAISISIKQVAPRSQPSLWQRASTLSSRGLGSPITQTVLAGMITGGEIAEDQGWMATGHMANVHQILMPFYGLFAFFAPLQSGISYVSYTTGDALTQKTAIRLGMTKENATSSGRIGGFTLTSTISLALRNSLPRINLYQLLRGGVAALGIEGLGALLLVSAGVNKLVTEDYPAMVAAHEDYVARQNAYEADHDPWGEGFIPDDDHGGEDGGIGDELTNDDGMVTDDPVAELVAMR